MNPFIFNPRLLTTVEQANYVLSIYDSEIAANVDVARVIEEKLNAISDVLHQTHPDLAPDLDLLVEHARYAGHNEGTHQELSTQKLQFRAALPYALKKQL